MIIGTEKPTISIHISSEIIHTSSWGGRADIKRSFPPITQASYFHRLDKVGLSSACAAYLHWARCEPSRPPRVT
jgi:hypothetical protein